MQTIQAFVEHRWFQRTVTLLIVINALVIGLETYPAVLAHYKRYFFITELIFLWIFTAEIVLRMIAAGSLRAFIKNGWNTFDFIIITSGHLFVGGYFVSVLRILRALRILRTITIIPSLQRVVTALVRTVPAVMNIMVLLAILFYIFAIVGSTLYHEYSPEYFGTLHATLLTLFQIVTLESWASDIMRPLLHHAPYSWIYFLGFILSGTFIVVNLFIAVIVSSVQNVSLLRDGEDLKEETSQQEIVREIATLKNEITLLRQTLEEQSKRDQVNK